MLLLVTGAFLAVSVAPALAVHTMAPVEGAVLNVDVWAGWVGDPPDYTPHVDFTQSFNVVYTGSVDRTYTFGAITMTLNGRWGGRNRPGCCPATPDFTDHAMMLTWGGPWDTDTVAGTSDRNVTVSGLTPGVTYDTSIWSWEAQDDYGFDISANGVLVVDDFVISSVPSHNDDNRNDFQSIADDAGVVVFTYSDPWNGPCCDVPTSTTYKINGIRMTPLAAGPARTWNIDGSGDWNAGANWTFGESPNANDESAFFGPAISSTQTVFTNSAVTVKAITFGDADAGTVQQSYVIAGQGSVTLDSDTSLSMISVLEGSHQFQAVVNLNNATDVDAAAGTTLTFNNELNLGGNTLTKSGGGTMVINNALNTGGGSVVISAGALGGGGVVVGDLTNNGGIVTPGNSPGELTVTGDYTQGPDGTLVIELAGLLQGNDYDLLDVSGAVTLNGGLLDVILLDGFQPSEGDVFDILDASAIGGAGFDSLSLPGLADGLVWDTSSLMTGGSLSVSAIPEPASISLLLAALGMIALVGQGRYELRRSY